MSNTAPIATIASLSAHEGQTVTLRGWLYNLRASGKLLFPIFRDGTGTIQGIVPKAAVPEEVFNTLKNLTLESSVIVTGKVRADSRAPSGYELDVENVEVIQRVPEETPFPITLKEHGVDFLMEHRHLWLRTPRQSAILRVRATIMRAAAEYFDTNGFIRTDPPILTPNACEGTSELFEMDYFDDDKAYLTQSGQLYIEATALALGKVYSFGPTFRAEKSKTRRHLTEFWMIEPEVAYAGLDDIMDLAEAFITHIVARVLEHHRDDLKVIGRDVTKLEAVLGIGTETETRIAPTPSTSSSFATPVVAPFSSFTSILPSPLSIFAESRQVDDESASLSSPTEPGAPSSPAHLRDKVGEATTDSPLATGSSLFSSRSEAEGSAVTSAPSRSAFPRLSYDEAHAMLDEAYKSGKLENPHRYGDDFGSPDETYISSQFDRPVMIHRYPAAIKAFYMQPDPTDASKALCVDVLAPEGYGEIIGGSQRVDNYDLLKSRIEEHNLPLAAFQWYLDLRRYGSVPHAGFGMGIERVVAWLCGLDHVRETIPFARTLNRIYP